MTLRQLVCLAGCMLLAQPALAVNECKIDFQKPDGQPWTGTYHKSTTTPLNQPIRRATVQNGSNNVVLDTKGSTSAIVVHIMKANDVLITSPDTALVKVQCMTSKSFGNAVTLKPTKDQILSMFGNDAAKAAKGLKDVLDYDASSVVSALKDAGFSVTNIVSAVKAAFGSTALAAGAIVKTLVQSGSAATSTVQGVKQAFGSVVSGQRVAEWLKAVNNTAQAVAEVLEQVFEATRSQVEQWLASAGYAAAAIDAALNDVYGPLMPPAVQQACQGVCGNSGNCMVACGNQWALYEAWTGQMGVGVTKYNLPKHYVQALTGHVSNLNGWKFGYASSQQADNATTDCHVTYYNSAAYVQNLRNGNIEGWSPQGIHWLLHELWHHQQCQSWGGAEKYAIRWWKDLGATAQNHPTFDTMAFHDAMPMEKEADDKASAIYHKIRSCCLSGSEISDTVKINRPLTLKGVSGPGRAEKNGNTVTFTLQADVDAGPGKTKNKWRVVSRPRFDTGYFIRAAYPDWATLKNDDKVLEVRGDLDAGPWEFELCTQYDFIAKKDPVEPQCTKRTVTVFER